MQNLTRLAGRLQALIEATAMIMLVIMLVAIAYQVFARYVLKSPTFWSEELARFLIVWVTMLGSATLIRENGHISVDFFVNRLPPAGQRILRFISDCLVLLMCGSIAYYGSLLVKLGGRTASSGLGIKMAYPYLGIVVGALLMALLLLLIRLGDCKQPSTQVKTAEV
uniref:TRAP transporter small permease n=1 Tax=Marinobacterium profundum TaxID=1714300 RepID=UPI00082EF1AE|nr:TRAP transporter small permease [Marinobacterium profundum]